MRFFYLFKANHTPIHGHRKTFRGWAATSIKHAFEYFVTLDLIRATPIKNVWPLRSQSACSQVTAVLFYTRTPKFVRAQICVGDMLVFRLQAKGLQHHLSQNIGPVIAGSARPAPPALSERNECVKET